MQMDYSPAVKSTEEFESSMKSLNDEIDRLKENAIQSAKDVGTAFTSQMSGKEVRNMFTQMQKENKAIEVKVITDKAEREMIDFAKSMGIKLNKEMKGHFSDLADGMFGDFDQSKLDHMVKSISDAYIEAEKKYNRQMQQSMFKDTDDMKIYEYLRTSTLKLDESTVNAKNNVDGFNHAIRNLVKTSKDAGLSLDQMGQELESMGVKSLGANTEDIAERMTKAVASVREFKHGFSELGSDIPRQQIESFVQDELLKLTTSLAQIKHESKETANSLSHLGSSVTPKEFQTAHVEALKMNKIFDETLDKNHQLAKDSAWKQQFQGVADTSNEMKKMKVHYSELEKQGKANIRNIQQSTIERLKAQAASVQQRATTKELSEEYVQQSGTIREQLSLIQARLQSEGKLTAEEVRQTQELKEQLDILNAQSRADAHDKSRLNPSPNEFQDKASWFTDSAKFYTISKAAKEATGTIKEVEMGMVEIGRVMTDASFVFDEYRENLFKLGVDYGQTFDNVQSIALRWAQSGYNVADSLTLTETSLLALNTAELDAKNATESMIGIMAQWQLQAEDMALVMDKINITADSYSVTSQDLVDGLLRSSSAARNMNMSLDETIGLLTVMREASGRTGAEVGNALNSILSYITRGKSIDTLESLGIEMFTDSAKTQFRNAMDIFEDIHASWNSLSKDIQDGFVKSADDAGLFSEEMANALGIQEEWNDIQQRDASQAAAGVYRRNYFIGMIERMANVQGVLNNMMDAEGYSMRENADAMDTLEKKQESLRASVEALQVAMGDAGLGGTLKALADGGTNAINAINDMPKPMKDLVLATTSTFTAVKALEWGMKTFGIQLPGVSQMIGSLTSGTWSLADAFKAGATGVSTFVKANAPLLALSAAIGVIVAITNAVKKQREEMEQSLEVFRQQREISNSVNELIPRYEELASKSKLNAEEQQKLLDVKKQITDLLPGTKDALDNENLSLSTQLEIIKDLNAEELERAKNKARENIDKYEGRYESSKKEIEEAENSLKKLTSRYDELYQKRNNLSKLEKQEFDLLSSRIKAQNDRLEHHSRIVNVVEESTKLYDEALKSQNTTLDESIEKTNNATKSSEDYKQSLEDLTEKFEDTTSKLQTYYSILDEVNSKEGLSAKSKQDIIMKHQELLPYLGDEAELRKHLIEIIAKEEKTQRDAYTNMLMYSEEFYNAKLLGNNELVTKLNEYYSIDLKNYKSLAEAKNAVESSLIATLSEKWQRYFNASGSGLRDTVNALSYRAVSGDMEAAKMIDELYPAYKKLLDSEQAFKDLTLDLGGIDFKGINTSGIKESKAGSKSKKNEKYENKPLEEALKLLEHRKKLSEETQDTIKAEIAELNRINSLYVKTEEERMAMAEKIYAAEKRLRDRTLQDSVNWINEKKNLNELSAEEEIAAWERVAKNQSNNIDAVKQATLELYKLRNQVMADSFSKEESYIKHLTKLGVMSVDEQIKKYRELYREKASDYKEEQSRIENLFDLYKKQISDQQRIVKEAHDKRIEQIEEEANKKKAIHEDEIAAIEKELELLNRQKEEYDHDKKMADLKEQLAYWQVRTSEDARKKVADILKQIDEAEHKREVDLKKQSLEDKKKVLEDEVKAVEDNAREEREKLEKSYKQIEVVFDEHSVNLIALASTMSKDMFEEFQNNYLIPLENALKNADYGSIDSILSGVDDFAQDAYDKTYNSNNAQIYRLANQIVDLKRQYEYGDDKSAAQRAVSIYDELTKLKPNVADSLHRMDYMQAQEYIKNLPKMHKGGKSLSYGAVEMMPGELTFPPDLSIKLEGLISALYQRPINNSTSSSLTDNRKQIKIEKLLNIENNYMEDDVDSDILVRQLQRTLTSM